MPFQPDIVVTGPDGVTLVVEAKTNLPDLGRTEDQLRHYMFGMHCPTGILVTPTRMWVYRDLYTSPPSVERVGELDMGPLWRQKPPTDPGLFESFVQEWLEHLPKRPPRTLPQKVEQTLQEYIMPALAAGELRAAHPRYF